MNTTRRNDNVDDYDSLLESMNGMKLQQNEVQNFPVTKVKPESAMSLLPDRNGCKPNQMTFDITCLSSCNKCQKKLAASAGIEKEISYHLARHTFADLTLTPCSDIYTVSKLLGHTSKLNASLRRCSNGNEDRGDKPNK